MANHRIWAPWRLDYVKDASKDTDCIFCAKPAEDDDGASYIVHRGERCYVILNTFPYTNGHFMVAPFEHVAQLQDLGPDVVAELMDLAQRGLRALDVAYGPRGLQRRLQPGEGCGCGVRGSHPPPRRPAVGRRHELHARAGRHAGAAADARGQLRGLEGRLLSAEGGAGSVPPQIFKAYDVRGIYGEEMDGDTARLLGRGFARVLARLAGKPAGDLRIGLGRDMRLTAPEMAERLREGLVAEGASVIDAGMIGTEMLYFLVGSRELDGGAMVTASHNPQAWTGVKLVREGALALSGDAGIAEVRAEIEAGLPDAVGGGGVEEVEIYGEFQNRVMSLIDPDRVEPLRLVVDGGNGMAGPIVGPLLHRLGLDPITTYWRPDGEFPDHEPNPMLPENRRFIVDKVLAEKADLGIAWDGDADRCFFIDGTGEFVDGDFLTALLASSVLERQPGAGIIYDVRASRAVPDTVRERGGTSYVNRVGHAFFKIAMREHGAAFGGEVSGHYYFRDFYCADSGAIPALLVLELLSVAGRPLSELVGAYRDRYFISGEINSEVADQDAKMRELAERYSDGEVSWLDGVSVDFPEWHFNVRPSNTEPLLRLNLESLVSHEDMERRRDRVLELIRS